MDTERIRRKEGENWESYANRVSPLLPNFPEDVLRQWFFEHEQAPEDTEWLDHDNLTFRRVSMGTEEIPGVDSAFDNYLVDRVPRLANLLESPRIKRIHDYFLEHGTWPRPVIFLKIEREGMKTPREVDLAYPFQLIEGHKRMIVFHALKNSGTLKDEHEIWIIER